MFYDKISLNNFFLGEICVYIVIVNGDLKLLKFLIDEYCVDVYVCVWGRFFMLEDSKDRINEDINFDGMCIK